VRVPIRVVGFAPELQRFAAVGAARRRRGGARTTFLHVSSCFPRKGVDALLSAWARAFDASDDVRLVIKGFPNPHNDVAAQIAALRAAYPDMAEIVFHNRDLSADALVALYAEADVMVLPTRGEGFNIPAAEALAAGLRLIVTGFGGHMDFCAAPSVSDRVRLLEYRLTRSASHVAGAHSLWAEPDADDLVRALREAAGEEAGPSGRAGADSLALAGLDAASWAERVANATTDLLLASPDPAPRIAWVSPWQVHCGVAEYSRHLLSAFAHDPDAGESPLILCDERPPQVDRNPPLSLRARPAFRVGDPDSVLKLAREVAVTDPEVLVIQHQPGLLPWEALAELLEAPAVRRRCVVVALHNTRDLLFAAPPRRERVAVARASVQRGLVHAVADLAVLQDLEISNTALLPHGATRGPAPRAPRSMPRDAAPVIGTTGFFLPHKGTARLLQAVALLRRDWPLLRVRLVCARYPDAGSDQEIARCRTLAADLDLLDAVEWETAFLPNERALHLLSGCDVVVMPYEPTLESASGAVRQALASGAPTLVSNLPVFADLGDAVERLELISPEVIAAHIASLLDNPTRRAALQDHAQSWLAAHDWTNIGARLRAMLDAYHGEYRASRQ
jgi:glycosyltransferase involved in cell wall biosynthesis